MKTPLMNFLSFFLLMQVQSCTDSSGPGDASSESQGDSSPDRDDSGTDAAHENDSVETASDPDCEGGPACPPPGTCSTREECGAMEACIDGRCESLEGALFCGEPQRAMVMLDQRLYAYVFKELHAYVGAACARRGFGIRVMGVAGLDDMSFQQVRDLLARNLETYPLNEGVLLAGNVPLPTFFMSRPDVPQVRLWPRYYEDLDLTEAKTIPDGTVLGECSGDGDGDGSPDNWPCVAPDEYSVPFTVPEHDFDGFDQGAHYGLEQWVALLPVGLGDPSRDTYDRWGEQLKPFLRKALVFYENPGSFYRNLYHVGNDLNMIAEAGTVWDEMGPESIDYYAINTLGEGMCDGNDDCYLRAPLEAYASLDDFLAYARTLPWMGEGWQSPAVFLGHMNSDDHFPRRIVWWNVHSTATSSIISSAQALTAIVAGKGGLIALLDGCMVGTYQRPGAPLPADLWETPYPKGNIMVSLIYGQASFTAAIGSIPLRTGFDNFKVILDSIYIDGYLGEADRERSDVQDRADDTPWGWRNHQEILIGDPFVDAL